MFLRDVTTFLLLLAAAPFFLGGLLGLLRFPDVFCRLHALTKADNLGLGLVSIALIIQTDSWHGAVRLLLTWFLVLVSSATVAHLIARKALQEGQHPWRNQ